MNSFYIKLISNKYSKLIRNKKLFTGGLGIGDWGLGIGPNPQSPIPKNVKNLD
jgi:hypothetical protein